MISVPTEKGKAMKEHDANEQRYRNGYAAGYEAGKRDAVKHGRWIVDKERLKATCSECGKTLRFSDEMQIIFMREEERFCYYCGAKMDGERKDRGEQR